MCTQHYIHCNITNIERYDSKFLHKKLCSSQIVVQSKDFKKLAACICSRKDQCQHSYHFTQTENIAQYSIAKRIEYHLVFIICLIIIFNIIHSTKIFLLMTRILRLEYLFIPPQLRSLLTAT